jgi:hypothetical protein
MLGGVMQGAMGLVAHLPAQEVAWCFSHANAQLLVVAARHRSSWAIRAPQGAFGGFYIAICVVSS